MDSRPRGGQLSIRIASEITGHSRTCATVPGHILIIRAEQRYGNGVRIFDVGEQTRAVEGLYQVWMGIPNFTDPPRRVRVGVEMRF